MKIPTVNRLSRGSYIGVVPGTPSDRLLFGKDERGPMSLDVAQERQLAHAYLDRLPPAQLSAVRSLLESMLPDPVSRALANAPLEDEAKADIRAIPRHIAMNIQPAIHRLAEHRTGNVKKLQSSDPPEFRVRVGDHRVPFTAKNEPVSARPATKVAK